MVFLALHGRNLLGEKSGYIGGMGNFESIMLLWSPFIRWSHIFKTCFQIIINECSFWPNCGVLLQNMKGMGSYKLLDSLRAKANFSTVFPYFNLNFTLRKVYYNFKCWDMLCPSIVIQIRQMQLFTTSELWDIQWKPKIDIFRRQPPCIYTIWPTEVKSYHSCTAITHRHIPNQKSLWKIFTQARWYR